MSNWQSNPTLNNVTFSGNIANGNGGGMLNSGPAGIGSDPTLENVRFSANQAHSGGGMFNYQDSSPSLTDVQFLNNQATVIGGGMVNSEQSNPTLTGVLFSGNETINSNVSGGAGKTPCPKRNSAGSRR